MNEQNKFQAVLASLNEDYYKAKRHISLLEQYGNGHHFDAPTNQLRDALDHIMKCLKYHEDGITGSDLQIEGGKAKEHLVRASHDSLQLLALHCTPMIHGKLFPCDTDEKVADLNGLPNCQFELAMIRANTDKSDKSNYPLPVRELLDRYIKVVPQEGYKEVDYTECGLTNARRESSIEGKLTELYYIANKMTLLSEQFAGGRHRIGVIVEFREILDDLFQYIKKNEETYLEHAKVLLCDIIYKEWELFLATIANEIRVALEHFDDRIIARAFSNERSTSSENIVTKIKGDLRKIRQTSVGWYERSVEELKEHVGYHEEEICGRKMYVCGKHLLELRVRFYGCLPALFDAKKAIKEEERRIKKWELVKVRRAWIGPILGAIIGATISTIITHFIFK